MEDWKKWNKDITRNPFHTNFTPFTVKQKITSEYGSRIPGDFRPELKNNTLLRHLLYRASKKQNSFVACVGTVRSGKSYFCLRFAEDYMKAIGSKFDVSKQCSFNVLPFFEWSQTATESAYVYDEIEIESNPRQWFKIQNRVINTFTDIQGLRRNVLFIPFPNIMFIDKHLRTHVNYIARTINQGKVVLYIRKTRPERERGSQVFLAKIGTIKFRLPSKETLEVYESVKKQFTDKNLQESIDLLRKFGTIDQWDVLKMEYMKIRIENMRSVIDRRKELPLLEEKQNKPLWAT